MKNIYVKYTLWVVWLTLCLYTLNSQNKKYIPEYLTDYDFQLDSNNSKRFEEKIITLSISTGIPDTNLINRMISKIKWKDSVKMLVIRGDLISLPQSIFQLRGLEAISIQSSSFEDFTSRIAELKDLNYVSYDFINFDEWPKHFNQITNLKTLTVYGCGLSNTCELLQSLSVFKKIEKFRLNFGSTDYEHCLGYLSELSSLKYLSIECRKIDSVPKSFIKLRNLETLSIDRAAHLSEEILQMPSLKKIALIGLDFKNDEEKCEKLKYWRNKYPQVNIMMWSNCPDQRNKNEK